MKYAHPIVEAKFVKREKRFFAHCLLPCGTPVVAHCPNTGSMRGNQDPDSQVKLLDFGPDHAATGRKLRYKWVSVVSQGTHVVVDTLCANPIVGEALREGRIPELAGLGAPQAEKKVGGSRFDFFLPGPPETYVEVKSVSMGEGASSSFPDAVTERGQKHIRELLELHTQGKRAVLFFLLVRDACLVVKPAKEIDPEYDRLLRH
ncbi:MAG: DNA/RNA nuclease SfsA, partial [Proteobacteria bacterium]